MALLTARLRLGALSLLAGASLFALAFSARAEIASEWVDGQKSRVRMLAGTVEGELFAFVEIELAKGWKTYWRNPGDAGGLPPTFDWSGSANLKQAVERYPAPIRMSDASGDTIGYKDHVVFPVALTRETEAAGISLSLALSYGICKEVCIAGDAQLRLEVPAGAVEEAGGAARAALEAVPRTQDRLQPQDPAVIRAEAFLGDAEPRIVVEATFAGGKEGADVFIAAPDGLFVPHPVLKEDLGKGRLVFEASLGKDTDMAALARSPVHAVLVGGGGASEVALAIK